MLQQTILCGFRFQFVIVFNELRPDRYEHLQAVIEREESGLLDTSNVVLEPVHNRDSDELVSLLLERAESGAREFGPALVFLDQFGFSAVPMETVRRIMSHRSCEVFLLLDFRGMNRWIGDPKKAASFNRAFGGDEWQAAASMKGQEQESHLLDAYVQALRERVDADYVTSFSMFDHDSRLLYRLIFCTNSDRGLEEMKKSMWRVDDTGECRFSDQDAPDQLRLLNAAYDQAWLADELLRAFAGQTVAVTEIREFVLTQTPCYLFKQALKSLESRSESGVTCVDEPAGRRPNTYPDEAWDSIRMRFSVGQLF